MNILQLKKYCLIIKAEWQNKLSLFILFKEKLWKIKQKQLKIKEKNMTAIEEYENQLVESNTLKSDYSAKIIKNYLKKNLLLK